MSVTSGRIETGYANYTAFYVSWWRTGYSQAGNYSDISWSAGLHASGATPTWYSNAVRIDDGNIASNGLGNGTWSNITVTNNTDYQLRSGSFRAYHDGNGNYSFGAYINGWLYANGNRTASGSWDLPNLSTLANVTTNDASSITTNSAVANGNVTWNGNSAITARGFCLSTSPNPTLGTVWQLGNNTGAYSLSLTGLSPNTTYYVRSYVSNGVGTNYGADRSFTTLEAPTVTTAAATNVAGTTATANGNLTNNGNPDVTEKGFVYGTASSPTTANFKSIVAGSATGAYSSNLTGLTPSTLYYLRSYAINSTGTVYGSQVTFSTIVPATVLTNAATSVTTTSAVGNGNITSDGGGAVTERGFAYGTTANPTTAGTKVTAGTGTGTFTANITSLTPSLTYNYRAYAINSAGTAYGSNQTFSTEATPPAQPSNLLPTSGTPTDDLTPTLSWQYNPGSANDTQKDYQVMVIRQSDSVTMWDSGKVTSAAGTVDVPGSANLAYGITYQWKVKSWNQADVDSSYSGLALFKESQKPVATITYPTEAQVITTNIPTITWTYSDSEATAQAKYWLRLYSNSVLIHDTGWVISTDTAYDVADNILSNLSSYQVSLVLEDSDGMQSEVQEHTFSIEFLAPALPLVATTQDVAGIVTVAVQLSKPPVDGWFAERINLYRKQQGEINWTLLEADYPVSENIIDNCEATTGWTASEVARTAGTTTGKYGTNSIGLGVTGAGDGIYTKTINVTDAADYDTFKALVFVTATNNISSIDFKFGTDSSNYYLISTPISNLAAGSWNPIFVPAEDWVTVGTPDIADLNLLTAEIKNATGSITLNQIRIDRISLSKSNYLFYDYTTAATQILTYAANAVSLEAAVSSNMSISSEITIRFTEDKINTYLVPMDNLALTVKGFMDGSQPPSWSHQTETKYYTTKGSTKPTSVVNAIQNYIEGELQLRFFDAKFNGQGLTGVESLQAIKNIKPLLLRTWWGRNYYISIDGNIDTTRRSGIGWYSSFTFTEINL